jgi:hypothetical protein
VLLNCSRARKTVGAKLPCAFYGTFNDETRVTVENPLHDGECSEEQRYINESGFGGLVVSMLASGTQDRGFELGRSRQIFRAKKSTACLPSEGK